MLPNGMLHRLNRLHACLMAQAAKAFWRNYLARPDFRLWRNAPIWRNLLLSAVGISAAFTALPLLDRGSDQWVKAANECQTKTVPFTHPLRTGQVVGFLSADDAMRLLQQTQRMAINPDYLSNARSLVHRDGSLEGSRNVYLVPQGMNVRIGDRVEIIDGRIDPSLPCHYLPNLIIRDLSKPIPVPRKVQFQQGTNAWPPADAHPVQTIPMLR